MASDEDLVGRIAEGDASALEALLGRYERPLSAFISRRSGGQDVEDLYQETWLRVVRAAPQFDRTRRFSTWLFQIATNLCRDWWRSRPREMLPSSRDQSGGAAGSELESGGSQHSALRVENAITVEALLAKLPDPQREALVLRYWHDFSESEMSEILGCPRGTVKSRIHNALARLSELVAETA